MKSLLSVAFVLSCALFFGQSRQMTVRVTPAERMATTAQAFLETLGPELREKANLAFDDRNRLDWHYVGRERLGVALGELDLAQRRAGDELLRAALSAKGYLQVHSIILLEGILERDPGQYFLTVFGDPAGGDPWSWRLEGHHVSLHFTLVNGEFTTVHPLFLGTNPAVVPDGPHAGLEVLEDEVALMRELIGTLNENQRKFAVRDDELPKDVVFGPGVDTEFGEPRGLTANALDHGQKALFMHMMAQHLSALDYRLVTPAMNRYRGTSPRDLVFLWLGSMEPGEPFYYRIHGYKKGMMLEVCNLDGNHVHMLWRDQTRDFGGDPLREHLARAHGDQGEDG